jgi:hypothetical protein
LDKCSPSDAIFVPYIGEHGDIALLQVSSYDEASSRRCLRLQRVTQATIRQDDAELFLGEVLRYIVSFLPLSLD